MVSFSCEELCYLRIFNMNNRKFCMGLSQQEGLFFIGEWIISVSKMKHGVLKRYDYSMRTKELKISKKDRKEPDFTFIPTPDIQSNSVVGTSTVIIEGCFLNNSPYGNVCLMNKSNELIYQGVMIDDKKQCFGIEYFGDLGQIEYVGCYWNNERHGFGMLYDRKGELVYEGDWLHGSNDYERKMTFQVTDNSFHNLIQELVIDEGCGNDYEEDLLLCGFDYLEKVVVKKNSLQDVKSLRISDNPVLKSIEIQGIEDNCLSNSGAFYYVKSVMISSLKIYD